MKQWVKEFIEENRILIEIWILLAFIFSISLIFALV